MKLIFILIFLVQSILAIESKDDRSIKLKLNTLGWDTNWNKRSIEYKELQSGGPSRDGIPPLDNAKFESVSSAKTWVKDKEPVIFLKINAEVKAYPLSVLMWHEIVNDSLGNKKIAVTFCPLCNSAIVFDRKLNGVLYDFGTSGLLRNSDLVMYDRQTESLWQQFTGEAIVGDLLDSKLKFLPSSIISFKEVYENFPQAKILSKDTGYLREYGKNPYSGYDDINQSPFMFNKKSDERLKPMQKVVTVSLNGLDKAYPYNLLKKQKIVNDKDLNLVIFYKKGTLAALDKSEIKYSKDDGAYTVFSNKIDNLTLEFILKDKKIMDINTNSTWNIFGEAIAGKLKGESLKEIVHGDHFWFSWAVFKPKTLIYK